LAALILLSRDWLSWRDTRANDHVLGVLVLSPVLDHCGCDQRDHRLEPAQEQLGRAASAASPVRHQAGKALIPPDSRWLLRFSTRSPGEELQRLIAAEKFRATLPAKLDAAEDAWHAAQPKAPDPVIIEHPIDTGDSQLLGGAMEIKAPWKRD
jgi:hypothetical protein